MKYKINYFSIITVLSYCYSIISFLNFYIKGNEFWLLSGISIVFTYLVSRAGILNFKIKLATYMEIPLLVNTLIFIVSIIYTISSIYGLYILLNFIPANDFASLSIPYAILSLLSIASTLDIYTHN